MQLIILGMHRSGTSVLARLLNMMGAYFAAEGLSTGANQENPKGFWERRDVRVLNDMLLHSVDCDWNRAANFDHNNIPEAVLKDFRAKAAKIVLDMDAHRPWLLKEPRLCLLFPLWREFFEVPHCLHIFRNPLEVAHSLKKRNGIPVEAGCALWEKYNIEAFHASAGLPRILISHHELMVDPVSVATALYDQLIDFGVQGLRKPGRQEVTAFVRDDLYRERSGKADLKAYVNAEQLRLFQSIENGQILRKKKIVMFSEDGKLALSSYEASLGPLEKKSGAATESPEVQLRKQLAQKEQEAKAAVEKAGKLETALKDRDVKIQAATRKEHELQTQVALKTLEAKVALETVVRLEAELKSLNAMNQEIFKKEHELQTQLALKAQEAKAATDTVVRLEAELKNLNGKNQEISRKEHELQTQLALKAQEVRAATDTATRLEAELKNLNARNQEISKKGYELQTLLSQKEQEVKTAKDAIASLEAQSKSLGARIQNAVEKETELQAQLALKEKEYKAVKDSVVKLESELKSRDAGLQEASRKETGLQAQLVQKEKEVKSVSDVLGKLKGELKSGEERIQGLSSEKKKLELQLTQARDSAVKLSEDLKSKAREKEQEISQLRKDVKQLEEMVHQFIRGTDRMIHSRRWKVGNFLGSLKYWLLFRSVPPISVDYIAKVKDRYTAWAGTRKNKVDGFLINQQKSVSESKEEAVNKPAVANKKEPYAPLEDVLLEERVKNYAASNARKKVAVYTCIIGGYDVLKVPEVLNAEYDYICFTDAPISGHPVWKFRVAEYYNTDATRIARYYKLHPHFYLKEYEIAVWVDANILIRSDIGYLIDAFVKGSNPLGIFPHYKRDCLYKEGAECAARKMDNAELINNQLAGYRKEGFPEKFGLPETNIVICRPRDPRAQSVMNLWWKEIDNGSKRDQVSIMYALWKCNEKYTPLTDSSSKIARFDRANFELFEHGSKTSQSNPSVYRIPRFLEATYKSGNNTWWSLLKPIGTTDADLWGFRHKTVNIVIPVHNALDDVKNCLSSVETSLLDTHSLIIVDDGSDEETKNYLKDFAERRSGFVKLLRHESAGGYTRAANAGIRASKSDYVILLNSDTIVPKSWLLKIIQCAESSKEIGIVGPLSNAASWQSVPKIKEDDGSYSVNPLPKGITVEDMDSMCEKYSLPAYPRVQLINGFCFCIKRKVIDAIGILDEVSYPKGYNEENDYCFRASDAGFDLAVATHVYVYHAKSKSYTPQRRILLSEESRKVFESRYGIYRIKRGTDSVRDNPLINRVRAGIRDAFSKL